MARNLKRDYITKILKMEVPNGYKFDLLNYIHNPAHGYDYPSFQKKMEEDEKTETFRRVSYFKYYDGSGEYREEIYEVDKDEEKTWQVIRTKRETVLERSNRFNIKKLIAFC